MSRPRAKKGSERWLVAAGIAGFWTLLALVSLSNDLVREVVNECSPTFSQALGRLPDFARRQLPPYALWAALTPAIFALSTRLPLNRASWRRRLPLHLALALAVTFGVGAYKAAAHDLLVRHETGGAHAFREWLLSGFTITLPLDLPVYAGILGAGFAFAYYRSSRRRQEEAARLEAQTAELRARLAEARLGALRHQLHPHFLFNTLNTVSALVERDPGTTRKTVARLSELLRRTLESGGRQEVSLAEEISFVEDYLEIERTRFGDRLSVRVEVPDELADALVPSLVLQPLAENAVRHGIARGSRPGTLEVRAWRGEAGLHLRVRDDGPGARELPPAPGVGLSNTAARLQALYGEDARLELTRPEGGGFAAEVVMPLRYPEPGEHEPQPIAV